MRAIITRANPDGTFDNVGIRNRMVTGSYKTVRGLIKHGVPKNWSEGRLRLELFTEHAWAYYEPPSDVVFIPRH